MSLALISFIDFQIINDILTIDIETFPLQIPAKPRAYQKLAELRHILWMLIIMHALKVKEDCLFSNNNVLERMVHFLFGCVHYVKGSALLQDIKNYFPDFCPAAFFHKIKDKIALCKFIDKEITFC